VSELANIDFMEPADIEEIIKKLNSKVDDIHEDDERGVERVEDDFMER
jgi:hypothetical protein